MNIQTNVASIQAHQTLLNNSAHNVANVNTDGFIPTQTTLNDAGNSITASSAKASDNGSPRSQTDLAKELPDQMIAADGVAVNVTAIRTQDEMLGSLLDIKA